jgi:hypothetical protein
MDSQVSPPLIDPVQSGFLTEWIGMEGRSSSGRSLFPVYFTEMLIDAGHRYGMVLEDKDIGV